MVVTNKEFLAAVFGREMDKAHVTSFLMTLVIYHPTVELGVGVAVALRLERLGQ